MQHGFEVDVATQDSRTIVQGKRRDWVIDLFKGRGEIGSLIQGWVG